MNSNPLKGVPRAAAARVQRTPGSWLIEWNAAQGGEGHYITDSKDMGELSRIAAVLFHDDADGETRANARLIAAAPDLLAALKFALSAHSEQLEAAFAQGQDAITKAEGGAA